MQLLDEVLALADERGCELQLRRSHGVFTAQVGHYLGVAGSAALALQLLHRELGARPALTSVQAGRAHLHVVRDRVRA